MRTNSKFILDACSVIAYFNEESGASSCEEILLKAWQNECKVYMNWVNVYEVFYGYQKADGIHTARRILKDLLDWPINIIYIADLELIKSASYFKTKYPVSMADSILLGQAQILTAKLVTADHHEFDEVDRQKELKFHWIR
jgi:predicted nucleic acid-binding protein